MFSRNIINYACKATFAGSFVVLSGGFRDIFGDYAVPFDTKGFSLEFTPSHLSMKAQPLYLSGIGMRKKNLMLFEVDIYQVGLRLSSESLSLAKAAILKNEKFSDAFIDSVLNTSVNDIIPWVSVPLKFVRTVSTNQVIEAFNEAFVGCDKAGIEQFKTALRESIGLHGVTAGEEIIYYWLKGGGLIIVKNGVAGSIMKNKEIEKRLLDVYVDPKLSVSPDLVKCIQNYMTSLTR